jgi:hypothetical protein
MLESMVVDRIHCRLIDLVLSLRARKDTNKRQRNDESEQSCALWRHDDLSVAIVAQQS